MGANVVINGSGFTDALGIVPVVKFDGVAAKLMTSSATSLTVTVPAGTKTGTITVTGGGGTATSAAAFQFYPAPTLSGISPTTGAPGAAIALTGTNFQIGAARPMVLFNGVAATIVQLTATKITVAVPAKAASGHIAITTLGGSATSSGTFTVQP